MIRKTLGAIILSAIIGLTGCSKDPETRRLIKEYHNTVLLH